MFVDTSNKQAIRRLWDLPILRGSAQRFGSPLRYFGMPGAAIVDILDWENILDLKTCIQIVRKPAKDREEDLETLRKMKSNLMIRDVANWQVLRGAIEDVIIKGYDTDRNVPTRSQEIGTDLRFQYTLYNLDFLGGIAYRAGSKQDTAAKSLRVRALETLFTRQRGTNFTLFLTVNVRDTFGLEPSTFFAEEAARSNSDLLTSTSAWLQGLDTGNKHHLLRLWIPLWIRSIAEMQGFKCHCFPAVFYVGHENARMVHFAFEFDFIEGRELRVSSEQSAEQIVQLPFLSVNEGGFVFLSVAGDPTVQSTNPLPPVSPSDLAVLTARAIPIAQEVPA